MTNSIDYLLIGHITADLMPDGSRALGGTVSYAAPIARLFGFNVGLLTSAAACEPLLAPLLDDTALMVKTAAETTTFENIYHKDGHRVQYVHDTAASLSADDIPSGWMSASMVHLAPLVDEVDPEIAFQFPDAVVMVTPQGWMRQWDKGGRVAFKRWFDPDVLKAIDLVVFSRHDVAEAPELIEEFAECTQCLVVTEGEQGGHYFVNNERRLYRATPAVEVDPTGAGDVFAVSMLGSMSKLGGRVDAAVAVAAELAGISVTRASSQQAITAEEVQAALQRAGIELDND